MGIPLMYAAGLGAMSGLGGMGSAMSGASQANQNIDQSNQAIRGIQSRIPGQSEQL